MLSQLIVQGVMLTEVVTAVTCTCYVLMTPGEKAAKSGMKQDVVCIQPEPVYSQSPVIFIHLCFVVGQNLSPKTHPPQLCTSETEHEYETTIKAGAGERRRKERAH